jgi:tryptophanyl-tRNA synthetase
MEQEDLAGRYRAGGLAYGELKKDLLERIGAHFAPARERRKQLQRDPGYVEEVLADGAARAREVADVTMCLVREAVGFRGTPAG